MKRVLLIVVILWLLCSVFNWGFTLGYFETKFPSHHNYGTALLMALGGPLALPTVVIENLDANKPFVWMWRETR